MCGYINDAAGVSPGREELLLQLRSALLKAPGEGFVLKLFTSGSFFDPKEVAVGVQEEILRCLQQHVGVRKVVVETRPEFVDDESLGRACSVFFKPFEIAVGLESASDLVRSFCVNKGFTFDDFRKACRIAARWGVSVKAYLLLKPPFLSEGDAIRDAVESVSRVAGCVQMVSLNVCNVQRGTLVEWLYRRGGYRPPWLWSVVEVLKMAKRANPGVVLISDPVGAGSLRGPSNCGECSGVVAGLIREFSLSQDPGVFEGVGCDCRYLWEKVVELEGSACGAQL